VSDWLPYDLKRISVCDSILSDSKKDARERVSQDKSKGVEQTK